MSDRLLDWMFVLAFVIYIVGIPVSFGVGVKMTQAPAPMFIAPLWPAVALGYLGYRLAP